jgi:hypothetical protein
LVGGRKMGLVMRRSHLHGNEGARLLHMDARTCVRTYYIGRETKTTMKPPQCVFPATRYATRRTNMHKGKNNNSRGENNPPLWLRRRHIPAGVRIAPPRVCCSAIFH